MGSRDEAKRRAALEAAKHVKDNFIVGLGSGTTVAFAIKEIGRRVREEKLRVLGVPTSYQAFILAAECGIPITTLKEHPRLDLDVDGADQIDGELNLIKGKGGGAIAREKIVAYASKKVVIVADETKLTQKLGEDGPLPVEVLPFAEPLVSLNMKDVGGKAVLRERIDGTGPFITDNGNFILDVHFGPIENPTGLNLALKAIPGVIETGLFIDIADIAYIGSPGGVERKERKR